MHTYKLFSVCFKTTHKPNRRFLGEDFALYGSVGFETVFVGKTRKDVHASYLNGVYN